ncbi:MAG: slipin family protein [DPANN group archaeon]|nr:slipin family protein [DPANN group archaeon]
MVYILIIIVVLAISSGLRVINEYERGVRFRLGKFEGIMEPGLRFLIPVIDKMQKVDIRVKAVDVPSQDAMTKDNVSVNVNAVLYYKIADSEKAIIEVEDFEYAISQVAQTTMRDIVGGISLDKLLSNRDEVSAKIKKIVDLASDPWGIKVNSVEVKDILLPPEMKRVMAKEAEAEREKRAVIINAGGEVIASKNLAIAAKTLSGSPGALHLRTLQTLNDISSDQSNTMIFALPLEIMSSFVDKKKK